MLVAACDSSGHSDPEVLGSWQWTARYGLHARKSDTEASPKLPFEDYLKVLWAPKYYCLCRTLNPSWSFCIG